MPLVAISRASALLNAMMPPFVPEYTTSPELPTLPASELMLMIRPYPRSIIPSSTALVHSTGPR